MELNARGASRYVNGQRGTSDSQSAHHAVGALGLSTNIEYVSKWREINLATVAGIGSCIDVDRRCVFIT